MLICESPIGRLSEAMFHLRRIEGYSVHFKCSPAMLSIIVSHYSPGCSFVAALQMMPEFFTQFYCDQIHHTIISLHNLFSLFWNSQCNGFSSLILSLDKEQHDVVADYQFQTIEHLGQERRYSVGKLPTLIPSREVDAGEIDYSSFVLMDTKRFKRLVVEFKGAMANVTITNSQIKFSIPSKELILSKERRQCAIGGIAIGNEFQFTVTLRPIEFFYNFRSELLWIFKSSDSNGLILTSSIELHAQISSYFPKRV